MLDDCEEKEVIKMSEIQEILTMLLSDENTEKYKEYFKRQNVVEAAKKVYDAADYLRKMPKDEAVASAIFAKLWLEKNN